jgi:hypothetical protein
MKSKSINNVIAEAEQIARVWEANETFSMGEVTLASLNAKIEELRAARQRVEDQRTLLTKLVNDQNDKATDVTGLVTRARSGFRATYGPNSSQYEQAGGTRQSEKKPRTSKKKSS